VDQIRDHYSSIGKKGFGDLLFYLAKMVQLNRINKMSEGIYHGLATAIDIVGEDRINDFVDFVADEEEVEPFLIDKIKFF